MVIVERLAKQLIKEIILNIVLLPPLQIHACNPRHLPRSRPPPPFLPSRNLTAKPLVGHVSSLLPSPAPAQELCHFPSVFLGLNRGGKGSNLLFPQSQPRFPPGRRRRQSPAVCSTVSTVSSAADFFRARVQRSGDSTRQIGRIRAEAPLSAPDESGSWSWLWPGWVLGPRPRWWIGESQGRRTWLFATRCRRRPNCWPE
ncbi:hypothetical protein B0T19DRAFT_50123 [Cercophora scortea]|uniref:Uncharacterized protein n=1 Tax=Cercophora scortea TaxID=314031 RepID=A0AAE0J4D7_9PEZI|nr:hypothetical protein B0T19DRAFT_50123 [Cercophora scortea]